MSLAYEKIIFDAKYTSKRKIDSNGYLRVSESPFTKEQVADYYGYEIPNYQSYGLNPNKIYKVYRPAEELKKKETLESMNSIPIQLDHHAEDPLDPPVKTRVGATGSNAFWDAPYVKNSIIIYNQNAIDRINDGSMRELSLGYRYRPEIREGIALNGAKYDIIMRDIRANHLALVEEGRAGSDVLVYDSNNTQPFNQGAQMDNDKLIELLQKQAEINNAMLSIFTGQNSSDLSTDSEEEIAEDDDLDNEQEGMPSENDKEDGQDGGMTEDDDELTEDNEDVTEDEDMTEDDDELTEDNEDVTEDEDMTEDDDEMTEDDEIASDNELTDEMVAKALEEVGYEDASNEIKEAFMKGMQALRKAHDTMVTDSKMKRLYPRIVKQVKSSVAKDLSSRYTAANAVQSVLGKVNPMAYDSASKIYLTALKKLGVSGVKSKDARVAFNAYKKGLNKAKVQKLAQDSKIKRKATQEEKVLSRIKSNYNIL